MQLTERSGGSPASVVRFHSLALPVGLLEVTTSPALPTSTHSLTEAQLTPKSDFAFGIFVPIQRAAPDIGSLEVHTPPLKSTATQRVAEGQEIPRRLPRSCSVTSTWPTVQAAAPAVGAVEVIITPLWPTPMQAPLASQCMPKIVSESPRLRLVSVHGDASAAVAPQAPKRARTASRRLNLRTARNFYRDRGRISPLGVDVQGFKIR